MNNQDSFEFQSKEMQIKKVYSPWQVFAGTFLGGPLAAIYLVWQNYNQLGRNEKLQPTIIWGIVLTLCFVGISLMLPGQIWGIPLTVAYSAMAQTWVNKDQLTKPQIQEHQQLSFHSNWRVVLIGIISCILTVVVTFFIAFSIISALYAL